MQQEPWQRPEVERAFPWNSVQTALPSTEYSPPGFVPFFPPRASSPVREQIGTSFIQEQERCYLCLKYMIPNESAFVVLPCQEKCRSIFHLGCIVNKLWHYKGLDIICPICTERKLPSHEDLMTMESPATKPSIGSSALSQFVSSPDEARSIFMRKILPLVGKAFARERKSSISHRRDEARAMDQLSAFRDRITARASYIEEIYSERRHPMSDRERRSESPDSPDDDPEHENLMKHLMHILTLDRLLLADISIAEIYMFLTNTFAGLIYLGFSLKNVKTLERTHQVYDLVSLYNLNSLKIRLALGAELRVQNILSERWSASTLSALRIGAHQLCILSMQKIHIPRFGFSLEDWVHKLGLSKTLIQILRVQMEDFVPPEGKLFQAGWEPNRLIELLELTSEDCKALHLHPIPAFANRGISYAQMVGKAASSERLKLRDSSPTQTSESSERGYTRIRKGSWRRQGPGRAHRGFALSEPRRRRTGK